MVCLSQVALFIHLLFLVLQMFQFLYPSSPPSVGQSTATLWNSVVSLKGKELPTIFIAGYKMQGTTTK